MMGWGTEGTVRGGTELPQSWLFSYNTLRVHFRKDNTKGVNVNLWVEAALRSELLIQNMNQSPSVWSESRIQRCFSYRVMHDKIPEGCFIHPLKYSSTKIFRNSSWMDYSEWCYVTGVDPHWSPKWELTQRADVNKRKPFCCLFRQSFTEC